MNAFDNLTPIELIHGAIRVDETPDGLMPWRLTPAQVEHFVRERENWGLRATCTAGMMIGLRTNSRHVALDLELRPGCRQHLAVDAEVEGQPRTVIRVDTHEDGPVRLDIMALPPEAPEAERELRIYLPPSRCLLIRGVVLDGGASLQALPRPEKKLLALGDSITQGMNSWGGFSTYPTQLASLMGADLLNQGIGGHVFDPPSMDPALSWQPDIITVAYGTNDWNSGINRATILDVAEEYLWTLRGIFPQAAIHVLTPLWRQIAHEQRAGGNLYTFSHYIREAAQALPGVHVIDGLELVPHDVAYMPDGTHPNELGFLHYATRLFQRLQG